MQTTDSVGRALRMSRSLTTVTDERNELRKKNMVMEQNLEEAHLLLQVPLLCQNVLDSFQNVLDSSRRI